MPSSSLEVRGGEGEKEDTSSQAAAARSSMFTPDPEASERNHLKLESQIIPLKGSQDDILVSQLNVPGKLCNVEWLKRHSTLLLSVLKNKAGIHLLEHKPYVSAQACFLIEHSKTGQSRTFTGTIQTNHRDKNVIIEEVKVTNKAAFENLAAQAFDPDFLERSLANNFPDSDWNFVAVVSIVFVFNTRYRFTRRRKGSQGRRPDSSGGKHVRYIKYFFEDHPEVTHG